MSSKSVMTEMAEVEFGMTNFDYTIDEGMEEALRAGNVYGRHAAYNFNGLVFFRDGKFHEEVWVYHAPTEVVSADSLSELMRAVNEKYGSD
jgi:hypothetical protein